MDFARHRAAAVDARRPMRSRLSARQLFGLLLVLALALVSYGVLGLWGGLGAVAATLTTVPVTVYGSMLLLASAAFALRAWRWHRLLCGLGYRIDWRVNVLYYLAGFAFTLTPGKVGEALRSEPLRLHGVSRVDSLGTFVTERLFDLGGVALLSLLALGFYPEYWFLAPLLIAVTGGIAWLLRCVYRLRGATLLADRPGRLGDLLKVARRGLSSRWWLPGIGISVVAWGCEGIAFWLFLHSAQMQASLAGVIGIYALATLAGALSLLPGGVGSTEGVLWLTAVLAGGAQAVVSAGIVAVRLTTLWYAVAIGVFALVVSGSLTRSMPDSRLP